MRLAFSAALDRQPVRAFQILVVLGILLVLVIDGIDIQLLSLVAPVVIKQWSIDRAAFGPAIAAALIGMSLGASIGGWIGDRMGRLATMVLSILLFGLATALASLTTDVFGMTTLRILSGLGFGAASSTGLTLVTEWLPNRVRPQVIGLLSIGTPAGGMIGASLVIALLPAYGWQGAFIACGILTIALAVVMMLVLRESPAYLLSKGHAERARKIARKILDEDIELIAEDDLPAQEGAARGVGVFHKTNQRLNIGAGLGFFTTSIVSYGLVGWIPVCLTGIGFSLPQALTAIFAFNLMSVGAAIAAGFLVSRFGSRKVLAISGPALCMAVLLLGVLLGGHMGPPSFETRVATNILVGSAGGFVGAAMASIYAIMATGYPQSCRASGIGMGMMFGRTGGIVTSFAGGFLLNLSNNSVWPYFGALGASAALIIFCAFIVDRHAGREPVTA